MGDRSKRAELGKRKQYSGNRIEKIGMRNEERGIRK
jgi:hypothetical protein